MLRTTLILLIVSVFAGCASTPPVIDFDPSADFTQYTSFAFISEHPLIRTEGAESASPLLEGRLMQTTEDVLTAGGIKRVEDAELADITIAFTVGGRDKIQVNRYPEPYRPYYGGGFRGGWDVPYYGVGMSTSTSAKQ